MGSVVQVAEEDACGALVGGGQSQGGGGHREIWRSGGIWSRCAGEATCVGKKGQSVVNDVSLNGR